MKIGTLGICQKCNGKLIFNGEAWNHRLRKGEPEPGHKPLPKAKK